MTLRPDQAACSDALDAGCPERKECARWVDRKLATVFIALAKHRDAQGCKNVIRMGVKHEHD
jgi:hypothetical protein